MARTTVLALTGFLSLTAAQVTPASSPMSFTATAFQNSSTITTTGVSGETVVTYVPTQQTVNSTTIVTQFPNSTTTRAAATTPNPVTRTNDADSTSTSTSGPGLQNGAATAGIKGGVGLLAVGGVMMFF